MHVFPTPEETDQAADLLVNRFSVSAQVLGKLFGTEERDQANDILAQLGGKRWTRLDVAKLLVLRQGTALFAGSGDAIRGLRRHLLSKLPAETIVALFERHRPARTHITAPSYMIHPLAEKKWHAGGPWPKDFVAALGFPMVFTGVVQRETSPTVEDFPPLRIPPKLVDFQIDLKKKMLSVLERDANKTRCVVTLPTGGGKTRVAVEAFIDWMQPRFAMGQYLIWIAQSEELCEQAITCIQQMWGSREFTAALRIYRFFGGRNVLPEHLRGGVVVASIQQLHNRIGSGDSALDTILRTTGAMIIDEAHRAVSAMYDGLLDRATAVRGEELFPVCGLTATPGRAGFHGKHETVKLVDRFEIYLVKPSLGKAYESNPLLYFRERGYLARAHHVVCRSGMEYRLTDAELEGMRREDDLPSGFRERLAGDKDRNLLIVRRLLEIPPHMPTLVYACTVAHAYFLSVLLNAAGRHAGTVSSDTPLTIRRALIHEFKQGNLDFLCNYGVLTTGFDAPKTECIVLCRPTTSEILYEQITGRGLRGPVFGGTEECQIVDFADNIERLGRPLAYARFSDFWTDDVEEGTE